MALAEPGTEEGDIYIATALTSMWIGYWVGSVLGYELSSSSDYDNYPAAGKTSLSERGVLLAPTVTTTPDQQGASIGLLGAF